MLSKSAPRQGKFHFCSAAHPACTDFCASVCVAPPPPFYFLEAELLSAFPCGFSLMRHFGVGSKNRLEVKRSPCHKTDKQINNWKPGPLCLLRQGGAGACSTRRKSPPSYF